jgi:outer membrane protein assembly factor BamD
MLVALLASCHNKKVKNPIAEVDSKQPDKVLFDRSMEAIKERKYDVARITLQTLINTYPDSEYIARAKLGVADSWYAEGGTAAMTQAEAEYKDFITFFPNMPEAAEAQLKIANIHFQQMEKPDRDFTHAKRAEEEYRQVVLQFPDSKLVPEAKERLREVQEVLAEREFRIGRFYYLRESWAAAIARLKTLTDAYPLYSQADEALYSLGNAYEKQIEITRASALPEATKGKLATYLADLAAQAYSKILTRYPAMARAGDAKSRLEAMRRPVPRPTDEMLAQNKAEQASRGEKGMVGRVWHNFHKRPDVTQAAKVGEPALVDIKPTGAPEVTRAAGEVAGTWKPEGGEGGTVTVETVKDPNQLPSQSVPRSDAPTGQDPNAIPELVPNTTQQNGPTAEPAGTVNSEKERSPGVSQPQPTPTAPAQVNEVEGGNASGSVSGVTGPQVSSSKSKKKKGLGKLNPF